MARYDKYDGMTGGFRAPLAADMAADAVGKIQAVGLDANGRAVVGAGQSGVVAVLVINQPMSAGEIVDCMTSGEIVDCDGLAAGTAYNATTAGAIGTGAGTHVGHTVEARRLVVRL